MYKVTNWRLACAGPTAIRTAAGTQLYACVYVHRILHYLVPWTPARGRGGIIRESIVRDSGKTSRELITARKYFVFVSASIKIINFSIKILYSSGENRYALPRNDDNYDACPVNACRRCSARVHVAVTLVSAIRMENGRRKMC